MSPEDYFHFFNAISPIHKKDFDELIEACVERKYEKRTILVNPGEVQQNCYLLLSGVMMSYFDGPSKIHVQAFAYPPGLAAIPESFSFQKPSPHFLQCMDAVHVLEIPHAALQKVLNKSHAFETLFRKMTEHILSGVLVRYTELHSMTIEERFRSFAKRSPHLLQLIPHKYLASYLGIDPTNFSKLINSIVI